MNRKRLGWVEKVGVWAPALVLVLVCAMTLVMFTSASAIERRPGGHSSLATATTEPADASATVLTELTLSRTANLDYGSFALIDNTQPGWIVVGEQFGRPTEMSNVDLLPSLGGTSAAAFTVQGSALRLLDITLPPSATLNRIGGGGTMSVINFTRYPSLAQTDSGGQFAFTVGARLNVNAGQAVGDYKGAFPVEVNYQ